MKPIRFRLWALAALLGVGTILLGLNRSTTLAIEGGQYLLGWHATGFGGGQSTGGDYAISSTVSQPEAASLSGGDYTLGGGFWGGGLRVVAPVTPTATATPTTPAGPAPTTTPTPPGNPAADRTLYLPLVDR